MQIVKRQRVLSDDENMEIEQILDNDNLLSPVNAAISGYSKHGYNLCIL